MMTAQLPQVAGSSYACSRLARFSTISSTFTRVLGILLLNLLAMASSAWAQLPIPASTQFDISGFIQSASLGGPIPAAGAAHQGGSITVNGHVIIVPAETVVILPASALTWQELFSSAPAPYGLLAAGGPSTGMALSDVPAPLTTYEAQVVGNRVLGGPAGADVYIAGLIYISQHALNTASGYINCINYTNGEMRVGGVIGNCASGTRVQINDPIITAAGDVAVGTGRYSRGQSPDPRFQADQDNPTIASATGFPMCMPRVLADPSIPGNPDDARCPLTQRPLAVAPAVGFATNFTTLPPGGGSPDPTIQAPLEVGDWITFAGTVVADPGLTAGQTAGPWPGDANTYISAHTISNNVAIYTFPGTNPAYVATEVTIIGTGGLTVLGAGEAVVRTRFEGMTTDVDPTGLAQRIIHLYGIDFDGITGAATDRDFGTISVDPGPPIGAVKGRWRFRPPCLPFGSAATVKNCVMNAAGNFLPPPREMRAVVQGAFTAPITAASPRSANGIVYGQYHAPILEYIFPENVPGAPIPENNFNTIPFLAQGGYTSAAGTQVGQLNPWPSNVTPDSACTAAIANAGGPYSVASGGTVTLAGSSPGTAPVTFSWTAPGVGTLSNLSISNPVYTAPVVAATTVVPLTFTATNCGGASVAATSVTINAPANPTVNSVAPLTVVSGTGASFVASGSDPNVPALTPLTFTVVQTSGPALIGITVTPSSPTTATVSFTAPAVAVSSTATLSLTATNTAPLTSAPTVVSVTINPAVVADTVLVTAAEYRTSKQRLILTATSNAVGPVTLKLQPYLTTTGLVYNPAASAGGLGDTFTLAAGVFTLDITGAPAPACGNPAAYATPCPAKPLDIKSSGGGDTLPFALTKIRQ